MASLFLVAALVSLIPDRVMNNSVTWRIPEVKVMDNYSSHSTVTEGNS